MGDAVHLAIAELMRILEHLADRVSGPMRLRLVIEPAVAVYLAVRAGLLDARRMCPPYLWAVFTTPGHARELLTGGWKDVGKVFLIAVAIDILYQIVVARWIYPGEALLVATLLAMIPYLAVRGPVTRIMRGKAGRRVDGI